MRHQGKMLNAGYGIVQYQLVECTWTEKGVEFVVNIELENGVEVNEAWIFIDHYKLTEWDITPEHDDYFILKIALGFYKD